MPITEARLDNEGSSKAPNLNNHAFLDMVDEADVDALSEYSNLNRAVSEILKNRKSDPNDIMSKKRRQRLTNEQQMMLEEEFQKTQDWQGRGVLNSLAKRLGLTRSKIYKWNWDRKKKDLVSQERIDQGLVNYPVDGQDPFVVTQERQPRILEDCTDSEGESSDENSLDEADLESDKADEREVVPIDSK